MFPSTPQLRDVFRAARRQLLTTSLAWTTGWTVTLLAASLAMGTLTSQARLTLRMVFVTEVATLVLGTMGLTFFFLGPLLRRILDPRGLAQTLDRLPCPRGDPDDASVSFLSVYELAHDSPNPNESMELRQAAISDAAGRGPPQARRRIAAWSASQTKTLTKWILPPLGCSLVILALLPYARQSALHAPLAWSSNDAAFERILPDPGLDNRVVSLIFPAYAKRPPERLPAGHAPVRVLPGTEITLEADSPFPLRSAELFWRSQDADEEPLRFAATVDERRLRARFVVERAGEYRVATTDTEGSPFLEQRGQLIQIEPDQPPLVEILAPTSSPLELKAADSFHIKAAAHDDFGVSKLRLVWRVSNSDRGGAVSLFENSSAPLRAVAQKTIALSEWKILPGDQVVYRVEAEDNDSINGPKTTSSRSQELRVYSEHAHHEQAMAEAGRALDGLVNLLSDTLALQPKASGPASAAELAKTQEIIEAAQELDEVLGASIEQAELDPLGGQDLAEAFSIVRKNVRRVGVRERKALEQTRRNRSVRDLARSNNKSVDRLERDSVYIADLLDDQRMLSARDTVKLLQELQQQLRDLIAEYKAQPSPEKRKALLDLIRKLKKEMQSLEESLAGLTGSIPHEFVNAEALKDQDRLEALDRTIAAIEEGRVDEALASAEGMIEQSEAMLRNLAEGRNTLSQSAYAELQQKAAALQRALQEAESSQKAITTEANKLSDATSKRAASGPGPRLQNQQIELLKAVRKHLDALSPSFRSLHPEPLHAAFERLDDTTAAVKMGDLAAASDSSRRLEADVEQLLRGALRHGEELDIAGLHPNAEAVRQELVEHLLPANKLASEIRAALEKQLASRDRAVGSQERSRLARIAQAEGRVREQVERIRQDMEGLGESAPMLDPALQEGLKAGEAAMRRAEGSFSDGRPQAGHREAKDALRQLQQAKEAFERAAQASQGSGMPRPIAAQPADGSGRQDGQGREQPAERVEIPQPEQYKVPEAFREELLDAAKDETVEGFQDAVRRYYEALIQ
jgi:hypothetical protein